MDSCSTGAKASQSLNIDTMFSKHGAEHGDKEYIL